MSVIVKGMEMPKDCGRCRFIGSCGVHGNEEWPDIESIMFNDVIGIDGKRDKDCPLRPLPKKHGRLIDATEATRRSLERTGKRLLAIDTAPTIVEAEGDDD